LRFPVFARNTEEYDVLIFVANWPKPRINAWDALLKARAIENMCYTIGVNRIGTDQNNHDYSGHSQAIDLFGNYLIEPQETEGVFSTTFDKKALLETRQKFGFLNDRDEFKM
jgi:omega-amidase